MKYSLLFALLLSAMWTMPSCKDDDDECSPAWEAGTQTQKNAYNAAYTAYVDAANSGSSDLVAKCNAYREAAQDYVDALTPYGQCDKLTGDDRDEFNFAIEEAIMDASGSC